MNNINVQKYKHIVQYFWDPEPRNDQEPDAPIWCLGREYSRNFPPYTIKGPAGTLDKKLLNTVIQDSWIYRVSGINALCR